MPSARPSANTSTRRSFPKRPTMNPHDNPQDDPQDEQQIASLLGASLPDAAPVDPDFLDRLRAQSSEAFSQSASSGNRSRPMRSRRVRWLAAVAATLVAAVGLYWWLAGSSAVALGQVLKNVENADTLHMRLSHGGRELEFWHTSNPRRSRWDEQGGHYRIADGPSYWIVNEKVNEARR